MGKDTKRQRGQKKKRRDTYLEKRMTQGKSRVSKSIPVSRKRISNYFTVLLRSERKFRLT